VIEDDDAIRRGVMDALRVAGHCPEGAARGDTGLARLMDEAFDLLLLDMVMPGNSGWEILKVARAARPELAIIVLTACGAEEQRVEGLQLGADDYVVKPFSLRELLARVEAVVRRTPARPVVRRVRFDGGVFDLHDRTLTLGGVSVDLSDKESALLAFLAARCNQVVSRKQLLAGVWGLDPRGLNTRTVDMLITRLREKLGQNAAVLKTVWGRGYLFQALPSETEL